MKSAQTEESDVFDLTAPCFKCPYCYTCRYWQNTLWSDWILKNDKCPVQLYTFDSLMVSILEQQEKKKQAELSRSKSRFPKKP